MPWERRRYHQSSGPGAPSFFLPGSPVSRGALLLRNLELKRIGHANLLGAIGSAAVGLTLALAGGGVWSLVAQTLTEAAITGALYWRFACMQVSLTFSARSLRELADFGYKILAGNGLNLLSTRLDDLLIGAVLGPTALGYYTVAYKLLLQLQDILLGLAHSVSLPLFSRLQDDYAALRDAWLRLYGVLSPQWSCPFLPWLGCWRPCSWPCSLAPNGSRQSPLCWFWLA